MKKTSPLPFTSAAHRPYFRPAGPRPDVAPKAKSRKRQTRHPLALTVIAELLGCHTATPYVASQRDGLATWVRSRLRQRLTRGARYSQGAQLLRTVEFNADELRRNARFVLGLRAEHQGRQVTGEQMADALGQPPLPGLTALAVWQRAIDLMESRLVSAINDGHLEEMPWSKAERYLDQIVEPRVRLMRTAVCPAKPPEPNAFGGTRRLKGLMKRLGSKDPAIVAEALADPELRRALGKPVADPLGWEKWDDEPSHSD